ncbi:MAG TPA: phospholipase [Cyanobacteria bacterium UBA12227]|nr:phospholipase [Cyanobacteria bacterium UBA12227]HAX89026.1 phospholipase [Cyanobacteria bacterium UBA11370]HBY77629.1 phospholipase [Cyanobacteria bacterium UBA11148]
MKEQNLLKTTEKDRVGLVLSGGGSRGAYHIGVVQCLADKNIKIDAISGASIGALNGAFIAAENDLVIAAKRLREIWNTLINDSPSKLGINVTAFLALKLLNELTPALGGNLLREASNLFDLSSKDIGLLDQGYIDKLIAKYISAEKLRKGLPFYVSVYKSHGALNDLKSVALAALNLKNTPSSEFFHIQSIEQSKQRSMILASAALPLVFEAKNGFADGGMGSFIDSQGNTPAYPLIDREACSHIIVTHLDNGSIWDRYKYNSSSDVILLEIRPRESMNQEGWRDLISFNANSIRSWIEQGYEDTERCLKRIRDPIILRRIAQKARETKRQALENLDMEDYQIN